MSNVLVTGCNGYIGRHLVPKLVDQGHTVRGADRRPGAEGLAAFQHGDINHPGVAEAAVEGAEIVFHLAAAKDDWGLTAEEYARDNVRASKSLIEAARSAGVRDWVFFSTVSVYGPSDDAAAAEETPLRPIHPYGQTKARAESLFVEHAQAEGSRLLIIRPSVVFGPGHPATTNVSRLIEANRRGRFLMVGKGLAAKTTSCIENLVAATLFLTGEGRPVNERSDGVSAYNYTDLPSSRRRTSLQRSATGSRAGRRGSDCLFRSALPRLLQRGGHAGHGRPRS